MSFNWPQFIDVADVISKLPSSHLDEANQRTAVGRAYYGVYQVVMDYAVSKRYYIKLTGREEGMNHTRLPQYLITFGSRTGNELLMDIGSNLKNLRENRTLSDYEPILPEPKKTMQDALLDAREIITLLEQEGFITSPSAADSVDRLLPTR